MYIYKSSEIRKIDQLAEKKGMPGFTLMELAGAGLGRKIASFYPITEHSFLILAGKGNNGGDGIVLARYLKRAGAACELCFPLGVPEKGAARQHLAYYESLGYSYQTGMPDTSATVIIDALLGAGTRLPLSESIKECVKWIHTQKAHVVAVDLPTGTASDSGEVDESALQANKTLVLHGYKPSRFLYPAAAHYGEAQLIDIGLLHTSSWHVYEPSIDSRSFHHPGNNTHKGTFGHGLLIAGTSEMPGSAALAALGAVSCGAGKLTVQTEREAVPVIASHVPEAIYHFDQEISRNHPYEVIAAGCGRAADSKMEEIVQQLLQQNRPVILDAGALATRSYQKAKCPVVLTPHPGEFARITGKSTAFIQQNRLQEASAYAVEQGVTVVLKGEYTVIAFADGSGLINQTGNEGLSKGGSGDTLTGVLLALMMRNPDLKTAVADAVWLHGKCADKWNEAYPAQAMRPLHIHTMISDVLNSI
ncbi:bifunctional ADP-dependent NAD(P)H-hydrate dehydratase/NAD(P)H-hydrate epimerase [Domibacillus robiginosus]|uniref:bifunctional ADP-dependent NAD(P)H-hydrate dehydratase/NAD(P)H-hydrate epimerase n=1 Tax=Domibacillus robiginosus TaxID=1071054 RepID=UPI00067BEA97|nr:bifunctional ADP-dependent NAD(P)H-hydrate dehydratase/NAD(P)H-hydrate epimerase [Domibacillus robiginosus]